MPKTYPRQSRFQIVLGLMYAMQAKSQGQIFGGSQFRFQTQVMPQISQLGLIRLPMLGDIPAAPMHFTLVRRRQSRQDTEEAGLAAAIGPLDLQGLASHQFEAQPAEKSSVPPRTSQVACLQQRQGV